MRLFLVKQNKTKKKTIERMYNNNNIYIGNVMGVRWCSG